MPLMFYPHTEDVQKGTLPEQVDILMEAAERYKVAILDTNGSNVVDRKQAIPRDQSIAYNWEAIARVLREIREMPEGTPTDKLKKAALLNKLAEIYEVLRAAKMPKLEAVRLALISEATQLKGV